MAITLGKWSQDELAGIISRAASIKSAGRRIDFLSRYFLDLDYKGSTLVGKKDAPEIFVVNLEGIDCFTFIDYVEAMRLSASFPEFMGNLKRIRYRSGVVAFKNRNHFFTDWREFNSEFVEDVTQQIGGKKARKTIKTLNRKEDGTYLLPGIRPVQREITYIPAEGLVETVFRKLKTGDYAGIYSPLPGLDVSHVGIIIKKGGSIYLRHASSSDRYRRVVDEDLRGYISGKPGLVILRPKNLVG